MIKEIEMISPISGYTTSIQNVGDEAYSSRMMGDGFAIMAYGDTVIAPFDGVVKFVYHTGHAIGIENEDGVSILIHVGLDLYKYGDLFFTKLVTKGDTVKKGQKLILIRMQEIYRMRFNPITIIVFVDSKKLTINRLKDNYIIGEPIHAQIEYRSINEKDS